MGWLLMAGIGDLNKRITIQYEVQTSDAMGGFSVVWTDLKTVWAAIWPVSANEHLQAMQNTMTITHRIRIRYRSDLSASYRIKYGTRYFNIVSMVNPNERGEWLDIMAKEAA